MSLGRLIGLTVLDLVLALLIAFAGVVAFAWVAAPNLSVGLARVGQALGLPVSEADAVAPWRYHLALECTALPGDDRALEAWLRDQPGVHSVSVRREALPGKPQGQKEKAGGPQGEKEKVVTQFFGPAKLQKPDVPWQQLGYRPGQPSPQSLWTSVAPALTYNSTDAELRLLCLGSLQAGLLIAGLFRTWQNRKLPPAEPPREDRALFGGL